MPSIGGYLRSFLAPAPTAEQREDAAHARDQKREVQKLERALTKAHSKLAESHRALDDIIDPLDRWRDGDGLFLPANGLHAGGTNARAQGGDWILLRTPTDLRSIRGDARLLDATNGLATGFLDRLVDFVVGDGHQVDFALRGVRRGAVTTGVVDADGDGETDVDPAVAAAQVVWDDWCHLNDWGCGEEDREAECYRRLERDGEIFLRFFEGGAETNGLPRVRFVEPEQIEPPPGGDHATSDNQGYSTDKSSTWGIETDADDAETRLAYYVRPMDGLSASFEGKWIGASEIAFAKLNTDRTIKRGISSFAIVARAFRQCEKINDNMAEVTAIQAAIAYVRQHAAGTLPSQITDLVSAGADYESSPGRNRGRTADRTVQNQITDPGTVLDMSAGMTFMAGPASASSASFIAAHGSRLRSVCARFGMPEFFGGDASNNNYASILVAGGPFERSVKRKQKRFAGFVRAVAYKVLAYAKEADRIDGDAYSRIEVTVTPPGVTIANKLEETQIRQIEQQAGVLSIQTWQQQAGYDSRQEAANVKAFKAANPDQSGGGGMDFGGLFGEPAPAAESYTPADDYDLLSEADRVGLTKKVITNSKGHKQTVWVKGGDDAPKPKAAPKADDKAQAKQHVADMLANPSKVTPENLPGLHASLSKLTVPELKEVARSLKEKVGGTKAEIAERIVAAAKAKAPAKAQSYQDKLAALAAEHPEEHAAHMASLNGGGKPAAKPKAAPKAAPKPAKAPSEHEVKTLADVQRLFDTVARGTNSLDEIRASFDFLKGESKGTLLKAAEIASLRSKVKPGMSTDVLVKMIAQAAVDRRGRFERNDY